MRTATAGAEPASLYADLHAASESLDQLMADQAHPFTTPGQFAELEARAGVIADQIRAAFRGERQRLAGQRRAA